MKGPVIVVDGDDEQRGTLAKELSERGFKVTQVSDGTRCLRLVQGKSWRWVPKIIFVDSVLGGLSAFELLRRLSEKYEGKDTILVMTSKFKSPEDEVEALNAGASGYLVKPFTLNDVESVQARVQEKRERIASASEKFSD